MKHCTLRKPKVYDEVAKYYCIEQSVRVRIYEHDNAREDFGSEMSRSLTTADKIIKNDPTQNCVRCFKKSKYKDAKGER